MSSIINLSYFSKGILAIPNINEDAAVAGSIREGLINDNSYMQDIIDIAEEKFLIEAIGYTETKLLYAQFDADGEWLPAAEQKYKDLVDGDDTVNWRGLRYTQGSNKISMIANYAYCDYLFKQSQGDLTKLGVSQSEVEHSKIIDGQAKFATVWNEMVEMYQDNFNNTYFVYFSSNNDYPLTLEEYLRQSDDFTTDHFRTKRYKNRYGL